MIFNYKVVVFIYRAYIRRTIFFIKFFNNIIKNNGFNSRFIARRLICLRAFYIPNFIAKIYF